MQLLSKTGSITRQSINYFCWRLARKHKCEMSMRKEEYVKTVVITTFEGFNIALLQIFA